MTNKFNIRVASASDLELLVKFRVAILLELNILQDAAEAKAMEPEFRNYIASKMEKRELFCWLVEHAAKAVSVGMAVIYDAPPKSTTFRGKEAYIFGIYTIPEMRGQGLGKLMMRNIIDQLHTQGYNNIWLRASKNGKPIYEKLGFVTSKNCNCEYMELVG